VPSTAGPGLAQGYPSHAVKFVVPYAAGGTGDIVARIVADRLSVALGQPVVVENRPGATGALGARAVASAAPDGHTLLLGHTGEIAINPLWGKGIGYDPDKDFLPVAFTANVPLVLVVPAKAPYATITEMLEAASERGLSFASAGWATPGHFAGEMLKFKTKGNLTHVPYNGATPALNDLLGGHVDLFFSGFPPAMPHVQAGSLKVIAVSSSKRSAVAPDVPTVAEVAAISDFDITLWQGIFAPLGTPKEVVARLNSEVNKILAEPSVKQKLLEQGADVSPMSTDQFASFVRAEGEKFRVIIKDANLTAR
jgi:tripartite-type tricarboxylate transporter receptor subunit TctC